MCWDCWWSWNLNRQNYWRQFVSNPHLISVDELQLGGALDVPESWRKSLSVEKKLLLFDDDDEAADIPASMPNSADEDVPQGSFL